MKHNHINSKTEHVLSPNEIENLERAKIEAREAVKKFMETVSELKDAQAAVTIRKFSEENHFKKIL